MKNLQAVLIVLGAWVVLVLCALALPVKSDRTAEPPSDRTIRAFEIVSLAMDRKINAKSKHYDVHKDEALGIEINNLCDREGMMSMRQCALNACFQANIAYAECDLF